MRFAGAASAIKRCFAPWMRCRASTSSSAEFVDSAYADQALPIACGQTISQPYVVAYMTEQLEVEPQHRVLEIGTGSGYQAAVLSRLARDVVSIERYRTLADTARERLKTLGFTNVTIVAGDGFAGAAGASAVRPHHRHRGGRGGAASAGRAARRRRQDGAAAWPARRHAAPRQADENRQGVSRQNLIAVRFVPLLPGQAREL